MRLLSDLCCEPSRAQDKVELGGEILPKVPPKRDAVLVRVVVAARALGADPYFILFVLAYDGVLSSRVDRLQGSSPTERRRLHRRVKRKEPNWPAMWAMIGAELRRRRRLRQRETLFGLELLPPNPSHRRRDLAPWLAFFDLRNYFRPKGRPRVVLNLLRPLLFPGRSPRSVSEGWSRRRIWFAEIDGTARLDGLRRFYDVHRELIQRALRRDTPLRELIKPDKDAAEGAGGSAGAGEKNAVAPSGTAAFTVFAGRCLQCGTEHQVIHFSPLPDVSQEDTAVVCANWHLLLCEAEREPGGRVWGDGPASRADPRPPGQGAETPTFTGAGCGSLGPRG